MVSVIPPIVQTCPSTCSAIKYLHATLHSLSGVFIILGLAFVEKFKVTSTERHFFSLHSWVGITAIALYVGQYAAGVRTIHIHNFSKHTASRTWLNIASSALTRCK